VSVGMVPFGTASDGGGSIRGPAAFTGLVGLRPSYGRIPTFGDPGIIRPARLPAPQPPATPPAP